MDFVCISGERIALHVEVKTEAAGLGIRQAEGYQRRVVTWAVRSSRPKAVMPHDKACAVYLAGEASLADPPACDCSTSLAATPRCVGSFPLISVPGAV